MKNISANKLKLRKFSSSPLTIPPEKAVAKIRQMMGRKGIDFVIVGDKKSVNGIITAYDICRSLLSVKDINQLDKMIARDLISDNYILLPENSNILDALEYVIAGKKVIIHTKRGEVSGIFTGFEALNVYTKIIGNKPLYDLVSKEFILAHPTHSIMSILRKMIKSKEDTAVIVDIRKRPIGIISYLDIVSAPSNLLTFASYRSYREVRNAGFSKYVKRGGTVAQDVMRASIYPVSYNSSLNDAILRMYLDKLNSVPVVDEYESIIGIVKLIDITILALKEME